MGFMAGESTNYWRVTYSRLSNGEGLINGMINLFNQYLSYVWSHESMGKLSMLYNGFIVLGLMIALELYSSRTIKNWDHWGFLTSSRMADYPYANWSPWPVDLGYSGYPIFRQSHLMAMREINTILYNIIYLIYIYIYQYLMDMDLKIAYIVFWWILYGFMALKLEGHGFDVCVFAMFSEIYLHFGWVIEWGQMCC